MSGYFDLPNTTLGGPSFAGLAELVADLTAKKDFSGVRTDDIGINNFEIQNLVDAFGFNNMVNVARKGAIATLSAEAMPYGIPLSKLQAATTPIVLGTEFADDLALAVNVTGATDLNFVDALHRGAFDISRNTVSGSGALYGSTTGLGSNNVWAKDTSGVQAANTAGYKWPYGSKSNMVNWTDISSLTNAKNIRFDNNDAATDFSAVIALVAARNYLQHDGMRDICGGVITFDQKYKSGANEADTDNVLREKIYLDLYNLCVPAPTAKEVYNARQNLGSASAGGGIAVYLKNGMFKADMGKNKTYYTTPASFKTLIDGKLSYPVGEIAADKWNEFQVMKDYGFSGSDVATQYAADLSGLGANAGVGAGVREAFAAVFGTTGGLEDQLTDYGVLETFQNRDGIKLADISASHDVTSLTDLVDKFDAFIEGSSDRHWSTTGMVGPTTYSGSKQEVWDKFQAKLPRDPLLAARNPAAISPAQEKRLRVFLEMHKGILTDDAQTAPGTRNMHTLANVGTVGAYAINDLILGISGGIVGTGAEAANTAAINVIYKDGVPQPTQAAREVSVINHANLKGWETTGILGNAENFNGLFTIDNAYNLRSRIPGLDLLDSGITETALDNLQKQSDAATRTREMKKHLVNFFAPSTTGAVGTSNTTSTLSYLHAGDFFTPGQFQKSFINTENLEQAANVALRYYDVRDISASQAVDTANTASFGYQNGGNRTVYPAVLRDLRKKDYTGAVTQGQQNTTYPQNVYDMKYVYDGLVRAVLPDEKSAIREILSWSPVPPSLYVDVADHSQYIPAADRVAAAIAAKNFNLATADANQLNRSLPNQMAHVLCNYFLDASYNTAVSYQNPNKSLVANAHSIVTLLEVEGPETIKALEGFGKGNVSSSPSPSGLGVYNNAPGTLTGVARDTIKYVLASMVQYGKSVSLFKTVAAAIESANSSADLIVDAYLQELSDFFATGVTNQVTFGDSSSDAYATNQHLGYWMPYLAVLTPAQIAGRVANEEGLLTIENDNQIKVLGLLKAATKGKLGSAVAADAPARITGLNAMFDAGVPKAFVDLAWTERGVNGYTNFAGSKYESSLDNFN